MIFRSNFGNWFAGYVDGEGCFTARLRSDSKYVPQPSFSVGARIDDLPVLEYVMDMLMMGHIYTKDGYTNSQGYKSNPTAHYMVTNQRDMETLVELFRVYPLRSKKAKDFELWAEIVELRGSREWRGGWNKEKDLQAGAFGPLVEKLSGIKKYDFS